MTDRGGTERVNDDHWEMFAQAMDLTIEGHRLIAEEIAFELGRAWRRSLNQVHRVLAAARRRPSSPE